MEVPDPAPSAMHEARQKQADSLPAIWTAVAAGIGLGAGRPPTRCPANTGEVPEGGDRLSARIFHHICHALVDAPRSLTGESANLDRDERLEHACLRLQATLAAPHGLRQVLGPAAEHTAYYDALPEDPLTPRDDPTVVLARRGAAWAERRPFAPHVEDALTATRTVSAGALDPMPPRHALGFPLRVSGTDTCDACAWCWLGGRGRAVPRCRQAGNTRIDRQWPACDRFELPLDCIACAACCREAYGAVQISTREPVGRLHPDLIERHGGRLDMRRDGDRCAALTGGRSAGERFACRIYGDRPRTCRDFTLGGEHCLTARRRVGLSR